MSGCTFLFILSLFSPCSAGGLFFGCIINGLGKDLGEKWMEKSIWSPMIVHGLLAFPQHSLSRSIKQIFEEHLAKSIMQSTRALCLPIP